MHGHVNITLFSAAHVQILKKNISCPGSIANSSLIQIFHKIDGKKILYRLAKHS